MTERRGPGRPATGHDPTRSVRIGSAWDEAKAIAHQRGDSLNQIITHALETYIRRHRQPGQRGE
jgi:hypothetical protein